MPPNQGGLPPYGMGMPGQQPLFSPPAGQGMMPPHHQNSAFMPINPAPPGTDMNPKMMRKYYKFVLHSSLTLLCIFFLAPQMQNPQENMGHPNLPPPNQGHPPGMMPGSGMPPNQMIQQQVQPPGTMMGQQPPQFVNQPPGPPQQEMNNPMPQPQIQQAPIPQPEPEKEKEVETAELICFD